MMMIITVPAGLEGVVVAETAISLIDGEQGRLSYRGVDIQEVVNRFGRWEDLLPWLVLSQVTEVVPSCDGCRAGDGGTDEPMVRLIRLLIDGQSRWPFKDNGSELTWLASLPPRFAGVDPSGFSSVAAAYLTGIRGGRPPTAAEERALNAYWVMSAEHGLNASTFAVRVAASTASSLRLALAAGVAALAGPLHGGAPEGVLALLQETQDVDDLDHYLTEKVLNGERLMGFGHRVYRTRDPRAEALSQVFRDLASDHDVVDRALRLEESALRVLGQQKPNRPLQTNVEYYAAVLMEALGIAPELCPVTFACGRLAGYAAHYHEQRATGRLIRPLASYNPAVGQ